MDQFVNAMTHYGVPKYAINLIFLSEEWTHKFKYFNDNEIKQMIHFYPTFYKNVIKPLNTTTEYELYMLSNQFNKINLLNNHE
jgi:hypothetical protein